MSTGEVLSPAIAEDISRRTKVLVASGYGEWLEGGAESPTIIGGLHLLRGRARMLDDRRPEGEEVVDLDVQILLGGDLDIPTSESVKFICPALDNTTLFEFLFKRAIGSLNHRTNTIGMEDIMGDLDGLSDNQKRIRAITDAVDSYLQLKAERSDAPPLTVVFAHGTNTRGTHFIDASNVIVEYTDKLLQDLKSTLPPETIPSVIVASCNAPDVSSDHAILKNPGFHLLYYAGATGGFETPTPIISMPV